MGNNSIPANSIYLVKKNDTLGKIAVNYAKSNLSSKTNIWGTDGVVKTISGFTQIENPNKIKPGKVLILSKNMAEFEKARKENEKAHPRPVPTPAPTMAPLIL